MKRARLTLMLGLILPFPLLAGQFSVEQLCKAAISVEMLRPVGIMTTEKGGNEPWISYTRDDGDSFLYKCKVRGARIVWSGYFPDTRSWGRWRDGEWDAVLTFREEGGSLFVTSSDTGSTTEFKANEF